MGIDGGGYFPHKIAVMADLLTDITAFIADHNLSESQFGVLALNDKNLVPQLKGEGGKRPRRLWPETETKVRDWMAQAAAERSQAAA